MFGRLIAMAKQKMTPFGIAVKKRLIEMGKTQVWLADQIGTSKGYLRHIFHGERSGKMYIPKIRRILGLDEESA